MIKNRTAQLVYQTVYCTLGIVGCIACLGIFDDIKTFRWDFYVYFTNLSNFLCLGVMIAALVQTIRKKEDSYVELELPDDRPHLEIGAPIYLASSTAVKGKYTYKSYRQICYRRSSG